MNDVLFREAILSQLWAALRTLKDCMDRCPPAEWDQDHGDYPFCHVVFHTLYDVDYHLAADDQEFRGQGFHREHPEVFADEAGLEDLVPTRLFPRTFVEAYYQHCWAKTHTLASKTIDQMLVPRSDIRGTMTLLERAINVVRHVQHHTGQLALTLQLIDGTETEWISWGVERPT